MITVLYYKNHYRVGVFGHAESGEVGHDLVCAAASMLVHTLIAYVKSKDENMEADFSEIKDGKVLPGMAVIGCEPDEEEDEVVREVFDAVCNGFALLAKHFPNNVEYFEMPKDKV